MTECEKNYLVCPTGTVCKTNETDYWCDCRDGYEEIGRGAGCKGREIISLKYWRILESDQAHFTERAPSWSQTRKRLGERPKCVLGSSC